MSYRRFGWIAVVVVAGVLLPVGVASAATPWTVSPSPNVGSDWLTGVSADSTTDAWAIGAVYQPNTYVPLVEHWNGRRWKPVTTGSGGSDELYTVNAESPSNVWIGGRGDIGPILLHYDGANWTRTQLPGYPGGSVGPVTARSASDVWTADAFFDSHGAERVSLYHWNGSRWWHRTLVVSSPRTCVTGVAWVAGLLERSKHDVWLDTGADCDGIRTGAVYRWNGTNLMLQSAPTGAPGSSYAFTGIGASSPTSPVFVVGSWAGSSGIQNSLADIYDGTAWAEHDPPAFTVDHWLTAVASRSASSAWAVGNRTSGADTYNLLDYWNGSSWTEYGGPDPNLRNTLSAVTAVPGSSDWWAVGSTRVNDRYRLKTMILHCCS